MPFPRSTPFGVNRPGPRHRRRLAVPAAVLTLTVGVITALVPGPAQAGPRDDKRRVEGRIDQAQDDLHETSADLARAYLRLRRTQAELPGAQAALAGAQRRVTEARERDAELGRRLAVAQETEKKAVDDLAATVASTAEATQQVGGIARQAYQTGGVGELSIVLNAESADDLAQRVSAVDTAFQLQGRVLADLDVKRAETRAQTTRLAAVRRQVALLKAQAAANLERARAAEVEAARAKARVEALLSSRRQDVATIEARKAVERRRLDALEGQRRALEAKLRAIAAKQRADQSSDDGGGGPSGGYLSAPVAGAPVTSEFGRRFHPILHYWRLHAGIDFGAGCGTPVRAAASGSIISAGGAGGYGNRIVIGHGQVRGSNLATSYNHLSRFVRSSGQVSRGELIGEVGTTGSSTGCHLHFETYQGGAPVNPRNWL
jgi:murein DD-endopeptidase MepM/ murein hydrolase activator NlpD